MMQLYGRKATKPLKAIRLFCGECMGMDRRKKTPTYPIEDVKGCTDDLCPLLDFRLGKNPYLPKRKGNPEALRIFRKGKEDIEV
jgi:hypothetical protein